MDDIVGYITTQIEVLQIREQRLRFEIDDTRGAELTKLRKIIERKQIELSELREKSLTSTRLICCGDFCGFRESYSPLFCMVNDLYKNQH